MIVEAILNAVRFLIIGIISLLPTIPVVQLDFLDGVFMLLSMADLLINVRVLASCLVTLILVMNIQFFWSLVMWVVRKIPGVS